MSVVLMRDELGSRKSPGSVKGHASRRDVAKAQETIYQFLLYIVHRWEPDEVLAEFRRLFIEHVNASVETTIPALHSIMFSSQPYEFRNTLKRSCYILINNWDLQRNHHSIQKLLQLFEDPILDKPTLSPTLKRLRTWIKEFVNSQDFSELKLFANRYEDHDVFPWTHRYTSYLLVPQYINFNNPVEQREAARALSRKLREQFKFDLALYTACSETAIAHHRKLKNPTCLGDGALRMIKMIVARRGQFSYENLAHIFIHQTQDLTYRRFKKSLQEYLLFSVGHPQAVEILRQKLDSRLDTLYEEHHDKTVDDALVLRTCNRIIEFLTTENRQEPAPLFILLLSEGNSLTLVILLLKLILICKYSRTHLESRIADLIQYYAEVPEDECRWVISFLEIFNITMTIHAENIEYSLVKVAPNSKPYHPEKNYNRLDKYRVFSQQKQLGITGALEISNQELERLQQLDSDLVQEPTPP